MIERQCKLKLTQELHKQMIKKFKRRKVFATCKDNIWAADLARMESLSSFDRVVKDLLCVIEVFTKYTWVKPLKDKKAKTILPGFVNESKRKPNKLLVDQGRELLNRHMQKWLDDNDILM